MATQSPAQMALGFAKQFFEVFDKNRQGIGKFFNQQKSCISWEGKNAMGAQMGSVIPGDQTQHSSLAADGQPTSDGGLLIVITGQRKDQKNPGGKQFGCTCVLRPGSQPWVQNMLYRFGVASINIPDPSLNVGGEFVKQFYGAFDTNRNNVKGLYTDNSMLTFEGEMVKGTNNIIMKLTKGATQAYEEQKWNAGDKKFRCPFKSVMFENVKHSPNTIDIQPACGGLLVVVRGQIQVDVNPMQFTETFVLVKGGSGFSVINDIFRLLY